MNLSKITIVLDQVRHPDNLGSALRAMKNTGLSRITLSAPLTREFDRARHLATDAIDLLPEMKVCGSLSEAVAHGTLVAGTTSRRPDSRRCIWLDELVELADRETDAGGEAVIVFGNERRGLSNAELDWCQYVVNIPTAPAKSSINLAQSVMLVAHALFTKAHRQALQRRQEAGLFTSPQPEKREEPAAAGMLHALYGMARPLLTEAGFLNAQNPDHILSELERLLERARPTKREAELLLAAVRQLTRVQKARRDDGDGGSRSD